MLYYKYKNNAPAKHAMLSSYDVIKFSKHLQKNPFIYLNVTKGYEHYCINNVDEWKDLLEDGL
jgi:hypothetical protein